MFQIGTKVRCKEPFNQIYGEEYVIVSQNLETGAWQILDGIDFDETNLEEVVN